MNVIALRHALACGDALVAGVPLDDGHLVEMTGEDSRCEQSRNARPDHDVNFIQCMRTRERPVAHAEVGHRSSVIVHLVNICRELGRRLRWDPIREVFLGDDEANRLRTRARRRGYELPEIS